MPHAFALVGCVGPAGIEPAIKGFLSRATNVHHVHTVLLCLVAASTASTASMLSTGFRRV